MTDTDDTEPVKPPAKPSEQHPIGRLITLARDRLAAGETPHQIALDWSRAVDAADDPIVKALPLQVGSAVEVIDGPLGYLVSRAILAMIQGESRRRLHRAREGGGSKDPKIRTRSGS